MRTLRPLLAGATALAMSVTLSLSGIAEDTADSPGEVTVVTDLVYATGSAPDEATELELSVHLAAGSEDAPMLLDVGGTVNPQLLAERGVSVFWPDYPADQGGWSSSL